MDKVTKFRKRAQDWEERAGAATEPETREHWQRVADRRRGGIENAPADLGLGAGAAEGRLASSPSVLVPIL